MNQIQELKNRIFNKTKGGILTNILAVAREFGCIGDILGRSFVVYDNSGKVVYNIVQKPIALKQMNTITEEWIKLRKIEEAEMKKSNKGVGRKGRVKK